jgi:Domain of unknown function (DUF5122) beta-propeller
VQSTFEIIRLLTNGQRDTSFGPVNDGRVHYSNSTATTAMTDLVIDAAGRIVFGGSYQSGTGHYFPALGRLTKNGLFDASFDGGVFVFNDASDDFASVESIVVTDDSVLTVSAVPQANDQTTGPDFFQVNRFDLNGMPVSAFGLNGSTHSSFGTSGLSDTPQSMILTGYGLVLAGYTGNSASVATFGVARLQYEHIFSDTFD